MPRKAHDRGISRRDRTKTEHAAPPWCEPPPPAAAPGTMPQIRHPPILPPKRCKAFAGRPMALFNGRPTLR